MRPSALPLLARPQQLSLLLATEAAVCSWSARLSEGDPERAVALHRYFLAVAEMEIGVSREVRRGRVDGTEIVVLVDEYAEAIRPVQRPRLSAHVERAVRRDLVAVMQRKLRPA